MRSTHYTLLWVYLYTPHLRWQDLHQHHTQVLIESVVEWEILTIRSSRVIIKVLQVHHLQLL